MMPPMTTSSPSEERVHVHFDRVFEEVINQHRPVLRILDRFLHVADNDLLVVGDHHGAPTEHVRRAHENGVTTRFAPSTASSTTVPSRPGPAESQVHQAICRSACGPPPGQIDSGDVPNDVHARRLERQRQIQGVCPPNCTITPTGAAGSFVLADGEHIF
jgi:hypothetical protein